MGTREAFYSPVITSWSFNEPMPWHCEVHKCFSVFSPPLGGTEWLEGSGAGWFPELVRLWYYLSRLGYGKIISSEGSPFIEEHDALAYLKRVS